MNYTIGGCGFPRICAIGSFDDFEYIGRSSLVPLTTVKQPSEEIDKMATQLLLAKIQGQTVESQILPAKIIIRNSCGCFPEENSIVESIARYERFQENQGGKSLHDFMSIQKLQEQIKQNIDINNDDLEWLWWDNLIQSFIAEVEKEAQGLFLQKIREYLSKHALKIDLTKQQKVFSLIREHVLLFLIKLPEKEQLLAQNLLNKAMDLIWEAIFRKETYLRLQAELKSLIYQEISASFLVQPTYTNYWRY